MSAFIGKLLTDILTEKNNSSFCPVRICGVIAFIAFIFMANVELFRHCKEFDLLNVSGGLSMILGVLAGGVTIKTKGEDSGS